MKEYDFVVIGSGIAGLSFALKAAKHGSVAVITKRKGWDTNTAWAQGGIACVTSDEDSFELHVRDTLDAGAGLCDERVVRTIVTEAPERIHELIELGLRFDEREKGCWRARAKKHDVRDVALSEERGRHDAAAAEHRVELAVRQKSHDAEHLRRASRGIG